ncbi:MAG: hypothetical protein HQ517_18535, partial [SAR324 cluster bacterium]|nr:hypothetical protein [SAR324 cluster bacterium]
ENARLYRASSTFEEKLKKISHKMCYRVTADPSWGIDNDIIFGAFFDQGKLLKLELFTEEKAWNEADFILAATPQEWTKILRKQFKFITRFMMQEVKLEKGEKVDILKLAPYSNDMTAAITQTKMQYPDEMSADELEKFRARLKEVNAQLNG